MTEQTEKGWQSYHTVWAMLFIGWVVSYADRACTGPVVSWMIANKVGFLSAAANPYALGGLLGSLFFAGYMLTQFPGGYFGDKFGYRTIIVISIFWAGITTLLTGLIGGLMVFVALRVLTGLGEGVLYSNDRSLVAQVTPPKKLGLGMGVVMAGLTVGLSAALVGTIYLINAGKSVLGQNAWKMPFIVLGIVTIVVAIIMRIALKPKDKSVSENYMKAIINLSKYSIVFLIVIMAIYFAANTVGLSDIMIAVILSFLAIVFLGYIVVTKGGEVGPVLKDRNLILIYLVHIPLLWHLWFYSFWGGAIVKDFGGGTLTAALLVISFNAIAGVIGFPLGGKISDMVSHKPNGRRNTFIVMLALMTLFIFIFTAYVTTGGKDMVIQSIILFLSGLIYFALCPVGHALASENAPANLRGAAFGTLNLVSEIGAILAPVVSGVLRGSSGNWGSALILDGILMGVACLLVIGVRTKISSNNGLVG
ncbi:MULTISPECIES: MFS transporter [unclassified Dehalobacter]|uniref:MFS transporter n=1 Tax=unclassified Dehalobacter TaxID=2635733 RepID=UPI000366DD3A|nr:MULTISPECIES: MFS transporter [unclassified Dehalobacter]RJE48965.1 MFS transporter [Dehalobacter sp. MCB1]TCX50767.1 MFS transporter [Dehalobacter sp. 12DCB1]TCX51702.1 MFS transporter [Dehalobacter sp. 14DCB1]